MEPITSDTILIMAGSFLCVFMSLVTVGGLYLYWRTRQLINSPLPAPAPPPVTTDAHAKPLGETPTRDETEDETIRDYRTASTPPNDEADAETIRRAVAPPPMDKRLITGPQAPLGTGPAPGSETEAMSRPSLQPLGLDLDPVDEQDDGSETVTRTLERSMERHIELPTKANNDNTPTVIIDRSQQMIDEEDEP